jgi:UDP-N-acetylmuramyl pentapeptide synthase
MTEGDVILFKGSRGMAMEKAATELKRLIKGE